MRNIFDGYQIIKVMPQKTPGQIKSKKFARKSYTEMEVIVEGHNLGRMFVRFAGPGNCTLHDNCFTCLEPAENCQGGDVPWRKSKK